MNLDKKAQDFVLAFGQNGILWKGRVFMEKLIAKDIDWINSTWEKLDTKLSRTAVKSRDKIPYSTINGVHDNQMELLPKNWTNGFWGGLMWLMYIDTKKDVYKETAERSEELMDEVFSLFDEIEHDVGFRWHILSGVNYRLTGNKASRVRNMIAGQHLASRYIPDAGFILPFNLDDIKNMTIIDTMMNIPQLYWMSREMNNDRFRQMAMHHADMVMHDHVREDGSVTHTAYHNFETGEPYYINFGQGYAVESTWSRGQAWAIYGFVLSYIHTGKVEYLNTAKKAAHYFISCVSDTDYLPLCDFRAPAEPVIYDSTAGAIAACGLIEIAKQVDELEKPIYINAAMKILKAMEEKFCDWSEEEDSILQMGTERYHGKNGKGIHIPIIYGDYFFVEALYKLRGNEFIPW